MRKNSGFKLELKIKSYLSEMGIESNDQMVIVGLSGGPDSMCLAHLLCKIGYKVIAAHINFKLRGIASDQDEKFAENWCQKKGIDFVSISYDTKSIATQNKEGIEETARKLRYAWFGTICRSRNIKYVMTGHHENDQAELILMNLVRGSGLNGAKGMLIKSFLPFSDKKEKLFLLRPLLSHTKKEILDYLQLENTGYRIDASNAENDYTRNKIRNQVLPLLESANANAVRHIAEFGNKIKSFLLFYEGYIQSLTKKVVTNSKGKVSIKITNELNEYSLYYLLSEYGYTEDIVKQIFYAVLNEKKGRKFISKSHVAIVGNKVIDIISLNPEHLELKIEALPITFLHSQGKLLIKKCTWKSNLSANKSKLNSSSFSYPLTVRNWAPGDRMKPLGMKGKSKKIKDILTDHKISGADKKAAIVLLNNQEIIWLYPTHTIAESVRCDESTKNYICIENK